MNIFGVVALLVIVAIAIAFQYISFNNKHRDK